MKEENEIADTYTVISPCGDDPSYLTGIVFMFAGVLYFVISLLIL